jgi:hypothetical protein
VNTSLDTPTVYPSVHNGCKAVLETRTVVGNYSYTRTGFGGFETDVGWRVSKEKICSSKPFKNVKLLLLTEYNFSSGLHKKIKCH